jgi:hypothetical protein
MSFATVCTINVVGTLHTEYLHVQVSNQDKTQGMPPCVATCPAAPYLASLLKKVLMLLCALQLRISSPYQGELWRCHVSCNSGSHLAAEVGSSAGMCLTTLDLASLPRRTPALPHVPRLWTRPPQWRWHRCCHVSHGSQWTVGSKREGSRRWHNQTLSLTRSQGARTYSAAVNGKGHTCLASATMTIEASKTCGNTATVQRQPLQAVDRH